MSIAGVTGRCAAATRPSFVLAARTASMTETYSMKTMHGTSSWRYFSAAAPNSNAAQTTTNIASDAPVWRKHTPGNRDVPMTERNIQDQYRNLLTLVNHHVPPRPEGLHRILRNVNTAQDFSVAQKALHVCLDKKVLFTPQTTSLWVNACIKGGAAEEAVKAIKDATKTRLFPNKSAVFRLVKHAGRTKNADMLKNIMSVGKVKFGKSELVQLARAYASVGEITSAIHTLNKIVALTDKADAGKAMQQRYALAGILMGVTKGDKPVDAAHITALREAVLPAAKKFKELESLVAEFEKKHQEAKA